MTKSWLILATSLVVATAPVPPNARAQSLRVVSVAPSPEDVLAPELADYDDASETEPSYDGLFEGPSWSSDPQYHAEPHSLAPHGPSCPGCGSPGHHLDGDGFVAPLGTQALDENWEAFLDGDRRYKGPGRPLLRESWLYRPLSIGFSMGGIWGDTLLDDRIEQDGGFFYTFRLGYDLGYYWGIETRIAHGTLNLDNLANEVSLGTGDNVFWDGSLLFYPWGDAAWRPYFIAGIGLARVDFQDEFLQRHLESAISLPIGAGVKYRWSNWCALRLEFLDNMVLGDAIDGTHHYSVTAGVELHFGGRRLSYWPWKSARVW